MDVNDHNRNLDEIMPLFRKILTMDDLNKLQDSLTGLIEQQKSDAMGKFADKKEIIKSIKSIESQVKIFMKNLDKEREKEKNESVILASKPVGGYKCASCEEEYQIKGGECIKITGIDKCKKYSNDGYCKKC